MAKPKPTPKRSTATQSDVTITFIDGEVKVYRISASPGLGNYLAREAGQCGVLSLFNNDEAWGIPLASIRDWSIAAAEGAPVEPEANSEIPF